MPASHSILIIDDDTVILRTLTKVFQRRGYFVEVGKRAKTPLKKSNNHYDVALIDLRLPDMQGTELFLLIHATSSSAVKITPTGKDPFGKTALKAQTRFWKNQYRQICYLALLIES